METRKTRRWPKVIKVPDRAGSLTELWDSKCSIGLLPLKMPGTLPLPLPWSFQMHRQNVEAGPCWVLPRNPWMGLKGVSLGQEVRAGRADSRGRQRPRRLLQLFISEEDVVSENEEGWMEWRWKLSIWGAAAKRRRLDHPELSWAKWQPDSSPLQTPQSHSAGTAIVHTAGNQRMTFRLVSGKQAGDAGHMVFASVI